MKKRTLKKIRELSVINNNFIVINNNKKQVISNKSKYRKAKKLYKTLSHKGKEYFNSKRFTNED